MRPIKDMAVDAVEAYQLENDGCACPSIVALIVELSCSIKLLQNSMERSSIREELKPLKRKGLTEEEKEKKKSLKQREEELKSELQELKGSLNSLHKEEVSRCPCGLPTFGFLKHANANIEAPFVDTVGREIIRCAGECGRKPHTEQCRYDDAIGRVGVCREGGKVEHAKWDLGSNWPSLCRLFALTDHKKTGVRLYPYLLCSDDFLSKWLFNCNGPNRVNMNYLELCGLLEPYIDNNPNLWDQNPYRAKLDDKIKIETNNQEKATNGKEKKTHAQEKATYEKVKEWVGYILKLMDEHDNDVLKDLISYIPDTQSDNFSYSRYLKARITYARNGVPGRGHFANYDV